MMKDLLYLLLILLSIRVSPFRGFLIIVKGAKTLDNYEFAEKYVDFYLYKELYRRLGDTLSDHELLEKAKKDNIIGLDLTAVKEALATMKFSEVEICKMRNEAIIVIPLEEKPDEFWPVDTVSFLIRFSKGRWKLVLGYGGYETLMLNILFRKFWGE